MSVDSLYQPLDVPSVVGWKEVPIAENGEPLVPLGMFSENWQIETSSIYAGEHSNSPYTEQSKKLAGALITQFVRAGVAERLQCAQSQLPEGHYLIVFDAYRTLWVQMALYEHYLHRLSERHPDWTETDLSTETQRYVSIPSTDPAKPSPHNTGGSVDLAITQLEPRYVSEMKAIEERLTYLTHKVPLYPEPYEEAYNPLCRERYLLQMYRSYLLRRRSTLLDFGTSYDHGGEEAAAAYYENRSLAAADLLARTNRRLLSNVMLEAGMQPYEEEWWHFNAPESQMGAKVADIPSAGYGSIDLSVENTFHERMRLMHHHGLLKISQKVVIGRSDPLLHSLFELNQIALRKIEDHYKSSLLPAKIISP